MNTLEKLNCKLSVLENFLIWLNDNTNACNLIIKPHIPIMGNQVGSTCDSVKVKAMDIIAYCSYSPDGITGYNYLNVHNGYAQIIQSPTVTYIGNSTIQDESRLGGITTNYLEDGYIVTNMLTTDTINDVIYGILGITERYVRSQEEQDELYTKTDYYIWDRGNAISVTTDYISLVQGYINDC